jgi:2-oxoisovalerate dehydrogenase E1 component subunit alpha
MPRLPSVSSSAAAARSALARPAVVARTARSALSVSSSSVVSPVSLPNHQKRFLSLSPPSASPEAKETLGLGEAYDNDVRSPFVADMTFISSFGTMPTTRVMDESGTILAPDLVPEEISSEEKLVSLYEGMVQLHEMDRVLYDVQRQGRISFYMTSGGEEGIQFGSASALKPQDVVYSQYREPGVLMYRGFTLDQFCNQCYSNSLDIGKGRQMPVHYGSAALNFQTISSPLATQIPQASGAGYKFMLDGETDKVAVCYFGDGAASEGDFHAALNFAATLGGPTIFFCRNNGYAISTPTRDQYAGDGIAARGPSYAINTIRVDGNDIFAVHAATKAARAYATREQKPVLIEAMSYRMGHHSTSDDASRYRGKDQPQEWDKHSPILRLNRYLQKKGWWDEGRDKKLIKGARKAVMASLKKAEGEKKPAIEELFTDVYDEVPLHLQQQRDELKKHLEKHEAEYGVDDFVGGNTL